MTQSNNEELEQKLTNDLKHTLKLVPSSQRELFVYELAKYLRVNYIPRTELEKAVVEARQQMVDYYTKELRKGYKKILPAEMVEGSIRWLQKEADRLAQLPGNEKS